MLTPIRKFRNLLFILLTIVCMPSFAQKKGLFSKQKVLNQYATVGIGGGSSHYFGDMSPYSTFYYGLYTNVRWNGSINYTRYLTSNVAARVSYTYARIFGSDEKYAQIDINKFASNYLRNLHFRNDLQEFTISGIFNILPQYGKGAKGRNAFMPYVAAGIGLYGHNPKARGSLTDKDGIWTGVNAEGQLTKQPWESLRNYNTSGQGIPGSTVKSYSLVQPVMPIAIGFRMKINRNFDFTAEAGLRLTPFDYLDDIGNTTYPSESLMLANYGADAAKFSYRANEDYSALTLLNRGALFKQAASKFESNTSNIAPSTDAENIYKYTDKRGTSRVDSYILTQFTISYILSNNIKCPVIK